MEKGLKPIKIDISEIINSWFDIDYIHDYEIGLNENDILEENKNLTV